MIAVRVLGPVEVVFGDARADGLGGPKQRAVLALLALQPGQVVSMQALVTGLWGQDPPPRAVNTVQGYVSNLRRLLGRDTIVTRAPGYLLALEPQAVDALRFRDLVEDARQAEPAVAACTLAQALQLWRGDALADLADLPFAGAVAAGLHDERLAATEERLEAELGLGRHEQVVTDLEQLVSAHPLRERLRGQLMLALYRTGRQADALEAFDAARHTLAEELGIDPSPELRGLHERILRQDPELAAPATVPAAAGRTNLQPSLTRFVGRKAEVDTVVGLLSAQRLVSLTGVGGVGKTRLAVEAAARVLADDGFPDGVWLVELAHLTEPRLVAKAVAGVLGVEEGDDQPLEQLLAAHLRTRDVLLVVDNCEHLVDACAELLDTLLRTAPRLRVLATSRERLGVPGELAWTVPPLDVTGDEGQPEAVELFVDRAVLVRPDFVPDAAGTEAVAAICRRLDGLPLAIELAAARLGALSVQEILDRLDDRFRLLADGFRTGLPRQQTLEAAVAWSHDLLTADEQRLLRRLAVFRGGFTLDAAEAVCAGAGVDAPAVLELLGRLVRKSLVVARQTPDDRTRYRLLETIRQYADARLAEADETSAHRRRHAELYRDLAERFHDEVQTGWAPSPWQARLEHELDNVRAALSWSLEHGAAETAARTAGALFLSWQEGHFIEGRRWLRAALAAGDSIAPRWRARALLAESVLATQQGDLERAGPQLDEVVAPLRAAGDDVELGIALMHRGMIARWTGDFERSRTLIEESLGLFREHDVAHLVLGALTHLGVLHRYAGDYDRARAVYDDARRLAEPLGDTTALGTMQAARGLVELHAGDLDAAAQLLDDGLRTAGAGAHAPAEFHLGMAEVAVQRGDLERARVELKAAHQLVAHEQDRLRALWLLEASARTALQAGDLTAAARLFGAADSVRGTRVVEPPDLNRLRARSLETLQRSLAGDELDRAWDEGRRLTLEAALAAAAPPWVWGPTAGG